MGTINVSNLGKAYKQYPTRLSRLMEWFMPFGKARHQLKWVLQEINFTVKAGEAVGIIGINGAGKSTLLKMITGTTQPTTGSVHITGRVAALLELGMGFHPDFTGRQNAYMAGQLLGMSAEEINRLMPEIEAFAEIGGYIDQPVRVYSSGMQVRLAFSLATVNRPDILIVDEALAVGDIRFQQKCFERIHQYKKLGTSLLFVSHDLNIIYRLCNKAVLINQGLVSAYGDVRYVASKYEAILKDSDFTSIQELLPNQNKLITDSESLVNSRFFTNIVISSTASGSSDVLIEGEIAQIKVSLRNLENYDDPHVGFQIRDKMGVIVFETNTYCMGCKVLDYVNKDGFAELNIIFTVNLARGVYTISFDIANRGYGSGLFAEVVALKAYVQEMRVLRGHDDIQWDGICNIFPSIVNKNMIDSSEFK